MQLSYYHYMSYTEMLESAGSSRAFIRNIYQTPQYAPKEIYQRKYFINILCSYINHRNRKIKKYVCNQSLINVGQG